MKQTFKILSTAAACVVLVACGGSGDSSSGGGGNTDPARNGMPCLTVGDHNGKNFPISNSCDDSIKVRADSGKVIELAPKKSGVYAYTGDGIVFFMACKSPYTPVSADALNFTCE